MKKKLLLILIGTTCILVSKAQLFIFNFTGTGNCPTQGNSVIQPANATVSSITRYGIYPSWNTSLNCVATNDYFNSAAWSGASSYDGITYVSFTITANQGSKLNISGISFLGLRSSTGPTSIRITYDDAGGHSGSSGDLTTNSSTASSVQYGFTPFTTTLGATVTIKIYGWGATGSTGTFRFNNLSVIGSVADNSPLTFDYTKGYMGVGLTANTLPTQRLQVNGNISTIGGNILVPNGYNIQIGNIAATNMGNYALAVNGTAIVNKLVVQKTAATWPDYVFHKGYKLIPLDSLQRYILQNYHLPHIPASEEIEKQGDDVGTTQATLLQEIEELTLYILDQNKKQRQQESEISHLRKQLHHIQKALLVTNGTESKAGKSLAK